MLKKQSNPLHREVSLSEKALEESHFPSSMVDLLEPEYDHRQKGPFGDNDGSMGKKAVYKKSRKESLLEFMIIGGR